MLLHKFECAMHTQLLLQCIYWVYKSVNITGGGGGGSGGGGGDVARHSRT